MIGLSTSAMGNGPSHLGLIFLLYIVFRLQALSQTFCPRAKGLKSDLMWAYMHSRAISCVARASLWISSRSQSLLSNLGISVSRNNVGRAGG